MKDKIRDILPENVRSLFDDITEQRVLGASKHISMIGNMIEAIAVRGVKEKFSSERIIDEITAVADYFIATRGEASQAVSNAIYIMTHNIEHCRSMEPNIAAESIISAKNNYKTESERAVKKCVNYSVELAKSFSRIFVYDYSSTVEKFLRGLKENKKEYEIYIAESRVIDGGKPFVKACLESGYKIKFIPDASVMYYIKDCDAAFMGAETFYPDGTGFNTIGSDIVGLTCSYYKIPLYFITPMIKIDIRPTAGKQKELVYDDLKEKLSSGWAKETEISGIDFITPELVAVSQEFIKAFITEEGIIPSGQMYSVSMEYSRKLR